MRAAIYARYSTDMQRAASIEDQVRVCRDLSDRLGVSVKDVFADTAQSGSHLMRSGLQKLLDAIRRRQIDVVIAEALDRLSRDMEDVAALYKQASFAGVAIHTVSEGRINELHVGLNGTMNALYIKQLAEKTHRGLRGRVEAGCSGGGNCYGYDVVRDGQERGHRRINPSQAGIILRIFSSYAIGMSPRAIALALNAESIPSPRGKDWDQSAINGNRQRGTGILNNELYIGRLVWNRQRFVRDPETRRRVARQNDEESQVISQVPDLRIIPEDLWKAVKARQETLTRPTRPDRPQGHHAYWETRRPQHLFSGLIKCACCGSSMVLVGKTHYGCATARNKGTCSNKLTIRRDRLEATVLEGLRRHLVTPELTAEFIKGYHEEINRRRSELESERKTAAREMSKIDSSIRNILEAIKGGLFHPSMKAEMDNLEARKLELSTVLSAPEAPPVRLHPNLAELFSAKVANLAEALNSPDDRAEAASILRGLIEEIRLVPQDGAYAIDLTGDLAALLGFASEAQNRKRPAAGAAGRSIKLDAGAGFEPAAFRL